MNILLTHLAGLTSLLRRRKKRRDGRRNTYRTLEKRGNVSGSAVRRVLCSSPSRREEAER